MTWTQEAEILKDILKENLKGKRIGDKLEFLADSPKAKIAQGKRILGEQLALVPGSECEACGLEQCKFNKSRHEDNNHLVLLSHKDFMMTPNVVGSMYRCIDRAVELVMEELP